MDRLEQLISYCKSKGYVFQSGLIYGGLSGFFDYGPNGVNLKDLIIQSYKQFFVYSRENVISQDGSLVTNPAVWSASGHLENFDDPVALTATGMRCRADHLLEDHFPNENFEGFTCEELFQKISENDIRLGKEPIVKVESSNLMFSSKLITGELVYFRPETCQNIFVNAKYLSEICRLQLPFGITQVGKVFRNEISPRSFVFRCREFEQMELEFFFNPETECTDCTYFPMITCRFATGETKLINLSELSGKVHSWHLYWISEMLKWLLEVIQLKPENLRLREHSESELSHYSSATFDIEYKYPFGDQSEYKELCGVANRTNYDLTQHSKASKKNLKFKCPVTKKKLYPYVIEPSIGLERLFMAILADCYEYSKERDYEILHLPELLSPIQYAIFPLPSKNHPKEEYYAKARYVFDGLVRKGYRVEYDSSGSIGRRYARQDTKGTKWCLTIDSQTMEDDTVTVRNRDNKDQYRVEISKLI